VKQTGGKDAESWHRAAFLGRCCLQDGRRTWGEKARRFWPRQDQAEEGGQAAFRLYT